MKKIDLIIIFCGTFCCFSCQKNWLDAKPNKALAIPTNVSDYQALLDNTFQTFNVNYPALQDIASDDISMGFDLWQSQGVLERNTYVWAKDIYEGNRGNDIDWLYAYQRILNEDVVLDGIQNISVTSTNNVSWNNVKGSALFYRAFDFYCVAQLFCKPFVTSSAASDLGIPLKLTSDVNEKISRSTVQETYNQIITDLQNAEGLLPVTSLFKTRPSKPATYGLLARVYLSMGDYDHALLYSDSCLNLSNKLIDYNSLDSTSDQPFSLFNDEVIFHADMGLYNSEYQGQVDSGLVAMYTQNDLRKPLFIRSADGSFKGSYDGNYYFFCGLATDEMYLIRAECFARKDNTAKALDDLNTLLKTRWMSGTFVEVMATDAGDALTKILAERRKELCFRGLRWTDMRRLNMDTRFAKTVIRVLNGQLYTLKPDDPRYVFQIPPDEIELSGIGQNP